MLLTRRNFVLGSTGALTASALGFPSLARAQSADIKIGWLATLTGPGSAPGVGFDRGVQFAAQTINAAGGVNGRKVTIITRDTQGDPTKAVNATQEMINSQKVHAIWGPTNSGESLAVTPIMARAKIPNIHPCVVDSLIDVKKYLLWFNFRRQSIRDTAPQEHSACLPQHPHKQALTAAALTTI